MYYVQNSEIRAVTVRDFMAQSVSALAQCNDPGASLAEAVAVKSSPIGNWRPRFSLLEAYSFAPKFTLSSPLHAHLTSHNVV